MLILVVYNSAFVHPPGKLHAPHSSASAHVSILLNDSEEKFVL